MYERKPKTEKKVRSNVKEEGRTGAEFETGAADRRDTLREECDLNRGYKGRDVPEGNVETGPAADAVY